MKRISTVSLSIILFISLVSCAKQTIKLKSEIINNISIFYGFSSYAMAGAEQSVIDDIVKKFDGLTFTKTKDKLDVATKLRISFISDKKSRKLISVDKNGIFTFDGEEQCYKISSGSFEYEYIKNIYDQEYLKSLYNESQQDNSDK